MLGLEWCFYSSLNEGIAFVLWQQSAGTLAVRRVIIDISLFHLPLQTLLIQ
jgi:lipoprotein signal peptidase